MQTLANVLTTNYKVVDLPVKSTPALLAPVFSNDPPVVPTAKVLASPVRIQECGLLSAPG